jgi:NADH:ubiquinone oxidoreductase subunit 6 (subunit J)
VNVLNTFLFYFFAALAVASAILVVTRRNVAHAAIFLVTTLLATAGIFLLLQAEFVFIAQVFLYAGGTALLFVFAGMLVRQDTVPKMVRFHRRHVVAGVLTTILAGQIVFAIVVGRTSLRLPAMQTAISPTSTGVVGDALFHAFIVPFGIAAVLLLVAMVGAVLMAKGGRDAFD